MILARPMTSPSLYAGASSSFAVWGLPTNCVAPPEFNSSHQMPVGIIDYGVPIVDEPIGTDRYVTLPGVRKGLIFDPGETRVFRDPLKSVMERFWDPKVSWRPDMMSLSTKRFTRAKFNERLLDGERIAKMVRFLNEELGHVIGRGKPSLLLGSKEFTLLAMKKYIEIFEFFPTNSHLVRQGLITLYNGMHAHGGSPKIMEELGAERPTVAESDESVCIRAFANRKRPARKSVPPKTIATFPREIEGGDDFIAIDDGSHPPEDIRLVMEYMNSHADDRIKWEPGRDGRQAYVSLAKDRLWIPVRWDLGERKLFFMKKDIPALMFVAKVKFSSEKVARREIMKLSDQSRSLGINSPEWLKSKLWAARELSVDLSGLEILLCEMLEQEHIINFFNNTFERYGNVETTAI